MSTRSRIAYKNENGHYVSVYCHWDGYPACNGKILLECYRNMDMVRDLISNGNLYSLGRSIGTRIDCAGSNNEPNIGGDDQCIFYGRDRGESGTEATVNNTLTGLKNHTEGCGGEWLYVFRDGAWFVADILSSKKLHRLTVRVCREH